MNYTNETCLSVLNISKIFVHVGFIGGNNLTILKPKNDRIIIIIIISQYFQKMYHIPLIVDRISKRGRLFSKVSSILLNLLSVD